MAVKNIQTIFICIHRIYNKFYFCDTYLYRNAID